MSYFGWLLLVLCFLSFGGAFILILIMQYGSIFVLLYFGIVVYIPYKKMHKSVKEFDDRVSKERREVALQRYVKVVMKQDVENETG